MVKLTFIAFATILFVLASTVVGAFDAIARYQPEAILAALIAVLLFWIVVLVKAPRGRRVLGVLWVVFIYAACIGLAIWLIAAKAGV